MDSNKIKTALGRVEKLLASGELSPLDRDLALELLREVYAELKFGGASGADVTPGAGAESVPARVEAQRLAGRSPQPAPDTAQAAGELLAQPPAAASGSAADGLDDSEPIRPDSDPAPSLFGEEVIEIRRTEERRVIFSLYGESEKPADGEGASGSDSRPGQADEPQAEQQPDAEPEKSEAAEQPDTTDAPETEQHPDREVEAEVVEDADVAVSAAGAEAVSSMASAPPTLREAIGVNDRFVILRDLFGGDPVQYDQSIAQLDAFDNLDDALIHIDANYRWNPSSEGARLLMELLTRKLG